MFYIRAKAPISIIMEVGVFCLLRLRPNPRRIQFCILETLRKCSGCAIFQIAYGRLTSFFFGFSLHGMRILPQNPVHICLGSLQRTHLLSGLLIVWGYCNFALPPASFLPFKRSVATTNFVVFGQRCVCTLPGDWGTPQQAGRDKLSPDSTKGWRAKGYPFPLLAKEVVFNGMPSAKEFPFQR